MKTATREWVRWVEEDFESNLVLSMNEPTMKMDSQASKAALIVTLATMMNVAGSVGWTANNRADTNRASASAPITPATRPIATGRRRWIG